MDTQVILERAHSAPRVKVKVEVEVGVIARWLLVAPSVGQLDYYCC
jgi:hypothetical protein